MASKLQPFGHLLGKVPDDKIAEMAEVKPATVAAYRRDRGIDAPDKDADVDEELLEGVAAGDADESATDDEAPAGEPDGRAPPGDAATQSFGQPPRTVQVPDGKYRITGPNGRTMRLRRRDIYRGKLAAWLWEHHRDKVEPVPRRG